MPDAQLRRVRILGDRHRPPWLAAARARPRFEERDFADTPTELRQRYFTSRRRRNRPCPAIRALVRFERRDLLRDPPPGGRTISSSAATC